MAQVRSCSSKESIDKISPVVALRYAPTAAVRRARSARARGPLASFAKNEELILKATLLPQGEALSHLGRSTEAWKYRGQSELRAPLFQQREIATAAGHALPALRSGRDHAQAATGGDVLACSKRILWVKSIGSCSWGSSTRAPGMGAAVPSSTPATPAAAVGAPRGPMMMSRTAGGRAWVVHTDCTLSHQIVGGRA